ncbi:hypothetical protein JOD97_002734 [Duganella sp. 1411]|uniref:hypothetical protein n=1 Tax=Duganella sp. 1411 TaxID=2806572 RepID=UPI001AEA9E5E|nr:hypothetical protein [Duganella sp. 1411]MBP1204692.1 hypothetical protein [Duganella sp. 1411]
MLLLSNGTPVERGVAEHEMDGCEEVDLAFSTPSQLNDRKNRTLQNEINAL